MEVALCDDSEVFLEGMRLHLEGVELVESVTTFSNLREFLDSVRAGRCFDVVFMDIDWKDNVTGLQAAEELCKLCPNARVIYVTGYVDKFLQTAFLKQTNLSGFLTKPVDRELLRANLQKVADAQAYDTNPAVLLKQNGSLITVYTREINFVESSNHKVLVHTSEGIVAIYERMDNIYKMLPPGFCQCHKSYIVNMNQIRRIQASEILLKSGEVVPVSRAKYSETKDSYFRFMGRMF